MKELSIEEKAVAYDEALKRAKELEIDGFLDAVAVKDIFPELAESEDDNIRKELIKGISKTRPNTPFLDTNITREEALAWLEKQGEQKPIEWSEEDENMRGNLLGYLNGFSVSETDKHQMFDWLKSLRPQKHWKPSDEQMKLLREVQQALLGKDCHNRFVDFMYELKRLREE